MKLQGLVLTVPVCDLRPLMQPASRIKFLSPDMANRNKTYIKGFGSFKEREQDWDPRREYNTVYYDCSRAISLPSRLPDNAHVTRVLRRVYLDSKALVRFELGIFTPVEHKLPSSPEQLQKYAKDFWQKSEIILRDQNGCSSSETFATALPKLIDRFATMTSTSKTVSNNLCVPLNPQIQVLAQIEPDDLLRSAELIDSIGKILLSINRHKLKGVRQPVDIVYLTVPFGYFSRPPRKEELRKLRQIRSHIAWLHADIEILTHIIHSCNREEFCTELVSKYVLELTKGLLKIQNDKSNSIFINLMNALDGLHGNRIRRLVSGIEASCLPHSVKQEVIKLRERFFAQILERDEVYPSDPSVMGSTQYGGQIFGQEKLKEAEQSQRSQESEKIKKYLGL